MFKKPGLTSAEGLQVTGIYLLIGVGLVNTFFPDLDPQDVQAVAKWWLDQDITLEKVLNYSYNGVTVGYLLKRLWVEVSA